MEEEEEEEKEEEEDEIPLLRRSCSSISNVGASCGSSDVSSESDSFSETRQNHVPRTCARRGSCRETGTVLPTGLALIPG